MTETGVSVSPGKVIVWSANMGRWVQDEVEAVEGALRAFFHSKHEGPVTEPTLFGAIESLTMRGGKRLRPLLLSATLDALHGFPTSQSVSSQARANLGAALELLQTYLLIHDDWMDEDLERRGGLSTLAYFRSISVEQKAAAQTILAGDLASAWAWEMLLMAPVEPQVCTALYQCFAQIQHDVVIGQYLDVGESDNVLQVYELKTGSYTTWGPINLACTSCNAPEVIRHKLESFARPLGLAFQLRDELLDVMAPQSETGKPQGSDLRSAKRTRIRQLAHKRLGTSFLERAQDPAVPIQTVVDQLKQDGITDAIEEEIAEYYSQACATLASLPGDVSRLRKLAQMMVERQK